MSYTLGQAARAAKCSKPTISRAIQRGRLSPVRAEDGSYEIDPAELYPGDGQSNGTMQQSVPVTSNGEMPAVLRAAYLAPAISRRDEEGFSSCSACPCHRAVASTPPRSTAVSVSFRLVILPSPYGCRLGPRGYSFSRPQCVHCCYGPVTRNLPSGGLVDRPRRFCFHKASALRVCWIAPRGWNSGLI